ncbi:UNVERIFIED_CONTAM: hypothetical protein FKN15_062847 [Acipenser sinensis]
MDPTTLATLLAALDQQREDAERRREAREVKRQEELAAHYTSLIQTDRGRTPRSCRTTASTSHLGHHTPRTTELDTSPPEHLHFSPPHKSTQRAERDLLDWDL